MEYRYLGSSGLQVSAISLGGWVTLSHQMEQDLAYEIMQAAFNGGINFFDNSESYGYGKSETVMGNVIRKAGWKRSEFVVSTKIFWGGEGINQIGLSRKHILEGAEAALARYQLDYVDLIFCHRPDIHTPVEESVRAMTYLVNSGKALYWGTSEWSAAQIMEAYAVARQEHLIPPQMEQPEYSMFRRERVEREYAHLYTEIGLGTTVWSPLAGGLLTGKYNKGIPEGSRATIEEYEWLRERFESEQALLNIEKVKKLAPIAEELGCTMAQLALAWCLKNPNVSTAITGASRPEQVVENMAALDVVDKLTGDVVARIEEILDNKPKPELDFRGA
jgi:voltage-dependent potassium channel beta subunit